MWLHLCAREAVRLKLFWLGISQRPQDGDLSCPQLERTGCNCIAHISAAEVTNG